MRRLLRCLCADLRTDRNRSKKHNSREGPTRGHQLTIEGAWLDSAATGPILLFFTRPARLRPCGLEEFPLPPVRTRVPYPSAW